MHSAYECPCTVEKTN